ncbi:uncharacterized protein [Diadema setosum]|uniref:uncharacterized protein n=1 Tax=Diadema setosum TaxID=31175 RepID=UPI003B3A77C0
MTVKCYEASSSVKLIGGPSPLEGILVLSPDRYVCYDGFNDKAAELVCGELGFPAAEDYSSQIPPSITTWNRSQWISCLDGYIRLEECLSHRTDCPRMLTVRLKCRDFLGFCDHPGPVPNGYWDSNITSFGSEITLTCCQGFILIGSRTLQCVGLPGWSTYFPVWNASVPSCLEVENETSGGIHVTKEFASKRIVTTSTAGGWRSCRRTENSSRSTTHIIHSVNNDVCTVHRPLPDHPRIQTGQATANHDGFYHICQNSAENQSLDAGMINDLGNSSQMNFISDEDIVQYQNATANTKIEHYMDMSGTVKKKKANVEFLQSGNTSETEKDIDENGYPVSNVSLLGATNNGPPWSVGRAKVCVNNSVSSFEETTSRVLSIDSTAADNAVRCGNFHGSVYEDILSTSDQSAPIREPSRKHEYSTIERNNTRDPLAIGLKDPLYSVSIYSSKQRQEPEVDESGYLVIEAYDGEIVEDRYVNMDKVQPTTTYLYENEI